MNIRLQCRLLVAACVVVLLAGCGSATDDTPASMASNSQRDQSQADNARPNIIVILADDVGYSDIQSYGSEIQTPHIDSLADNGVLMTNFHTTPLCATSRVELLTGADHHLVGMGEMGSMKLLYLLKNKPNYAGQLDSRGLSIAQLLKNAGYHTYMAGKWGIGGVGPKGEGFEQSFNLAKGADYASNFAPPPGYNPGLAFNPPYPAYQPHFENGKKVAKLPADFFSTDYYTNKIIQDIDENHGDGKPFFGYLAFQAAHFPLQAPDKYLDCNKGRPGCYKGVYDAGYKAIRDARIARMKKRGIISQDFNPHAFSSVPMTRYGRPGVVQNKPWNQLTQTQKQHEARIMEVYAAMMTDMDDNVGRLIKYLKSIHEYRNTMIVFLSDNGADGMGYGFLPFFDSNLNTDINNAFSNYGRPGSFIFRSTRWAEVGTAPFRLFKAFPAEGGISVPAIVKMPHGLALPPSNAYAQLQDIVPTILAMTGVKPPSSDTYDGHPVAAIEGKSLLPALEGATASVHSNDAVFADEVAAQRYVRQGQWKMTRIANYFFPSPANNLPRQWQLYNIDKDRGETHDVAAEHPEIVRKLKQDWRRYAKRVDAVNPTILPPLIPITQ